MSTVSPAATEIHYPSSDGKPMAETDIHRDWMFCIISRLQRFFAGVRNYVSGNLLVYYVEGNPRKSFAPDVFVVKDCEPRRRNIFKIWKEGKVPNFILETTSDTTQHEDLGRKMRLYAELKVAEYFLYDPRGDWLNPALLGFRLVGGGYVPLEMDEQGALFSEQLGITFKLEDGQLAMFETARGKRLLSDGEQAAEEARRADEEARRANEAERRLAQEIAARRAAEEELARLRNNN
jgi:Uma2 family endonuclease